MAGSRLGLRLRDLNWELGRDDCFRGRSWLCLRDFLSLAVYTDLEMKRDRVRHDIMLEDIFSVHVCKEPHMP